MRTNLKSIAIPVLRWTVGLVVFLESYRTFRFAFSHLHPAQALGIHPVVLLVLAGPEMIAAILFLCPRLVIIGSYALLAIFALAIMVHLLPRAMELRGSSGLRRRGPGRGDALARPELERWAPGYLAFDNSTPLAGRRSVRWGGAKHDNHD